jgi:hypothetical protein
METHQIYGPGRATYGNYGQNLGALRAIPGSCGKNGRIGFSRDSNPDSSVFLINVKTGHRAHNFYCTVFLQFSYSRSNIQADYGYIRTAETYTPSSFYVYDKSHVSTVIILLFSIYDT